MMHYMYVHVEFRFAWKNLLQNAFQLNFQVIQQIRDIFEVSGETD